MTPEEFEKYVKERLRPDESAARIFLDILSKFRTVKWERTCEGCKYKDKQLGCGTCSRFWKDLYQPTTEAK